MTPMIVSVVQDSTAIIVIVDTAIGRRVSLC